MGLFSFARASAAFGKAMRLSGAGHEVEALKVLRKAKSLVSPPRSTPAFALGLSIAEEIAIIAERIGDQALAIKSLEEALQIYGNECLRAPLLGKQPELEAWEKRARARLHRESGDASSR